MHTRNKVTQTISIIFPKKLLKILYLLILLVCTPSPRLSRLARSLPLPVTFLLHKPFFVSVLPISEGILSIGVQGLGVLFLRKPYLVPGPLRY